MRIQEFQLKMHRRGLSEGYSHTWVSGVDSDLCEVAIFLEGLWISHYDMIMNALVDTYGTFGSTWGEVRRDRDRICFVTYLSDGEDHVWISYSSFLMVLNDWKEVLLYLPNEVMLHRRGEDIWAVFEKNSSHKVIIKDSLSGYQLFISTPDEAMTIATCLLNDDGKCRNLSIVSQYQVLLESFRAYKKKGYFLMFLEKNHEEWTVAHNDTKLDERGYEVDFR